MLPDVLVQELLFFETKLTYFVQSRFSYFERFFYFVNVASDPKNAVLYMFPCIAALCGPFSYLSFDLILVGTLINWMSTELKWILRGDRPFWWVKEVSQTFPSIPHLRQTYNTCVANPGNPSDHVMLSSGILFVIFSALFSINKKSCRNLSKSSSGGSFIAQWYPYRVKMGLWTWYIVILSVITLSQVYNATHFLHQCFLGAVLGGLVANTVWINWSSDWQRRQKSFKLLFYASIFTFVSFGSYWVQKASGIDPQLAVRLAFKWCFSPTDINVNTTSIYSLTNSCGSILGLVIALIIQRFSVKLISYRRTDSAIELPFKSFAKGSNLLFYIGNVVGVIISAYFLVQLRKDIPTDSVAVFYLYHFFVNVAAPIFYLAFVPIILALCTKVRKKQD